MNPLYCSYHQTTKDRSEPSWAETSRFSRAVDLVVTNGGNKATTSQLMWLKSFQSMQAIPSSARLNAPGLGGRPLSEVVKNLPNESILSLAPYHGGDERYT